MTILNPKILFIPVSSPEGIGEYMRSLIIAQAIIKQWPSADIHFILSEQTSYASSCPFTTHLTPTSPTKHTKQVNSIIARLSPNITIFDASGRKSQLAAAKRCGSSVIFISQHKKKRSRGLNWGRLKLTDIHWVVQPPFILGDITAIQKLKLKLLNKKAPSNIGPVFSPVNASVQKQLLTHYQLHENEYIIFNAGSGGHQVNGELAADVYARAAEAITQQLDVTCVMIYGDNYPNDIQSKNKHIAIKSLNHEEFIALVDAAKLVVISGGDSLLQTISMKKPCLTSPVSKDQPHRIAACVNNQLAIATETESNVMIERIKSLLDDDSLAKLQSTLNHSSCSNGLDLALKDIKCLIEETLINV